MFRNDVWVSSVEGFGGDAPGGGRVVTKEFNVEFGGVIVDFGFDSCGGELGRGVAVQARSSIFKLSFAMLKCV